MVVIVAAGALVIDAIPEMSVFLRTRVDSIRSLLTPRLAVSFAAAGAAFLAGLAFAWYETVVLLGGVPIGAMLLGAALTIVYLGFVVALVAAVASHTGSVLTTVAIAIVILLVLPILGIVEAVGRWLPSHLLGALDALVRNTEPWTEYVPATIVAAVVSVVLITISTLWAAAREL